MNRKIKPELDFKAKSYYEIISWSETLVTEPPLTKGISGEKLEVYANTDSPNNFDNLIQLLCHTKAVWKHINASIPESCGDLSDLLQNLEKKSLLLSPNKTIPCKPIIIQTKSI